MKKLKPNFKLIGVLIIVILFAIPVMHRLFNIPLKFIQDWRWETRVLKTQKALLLNIPSNTKKITLNMDLNNNNLDFYFTEKSSLVRDWWTYRDLEKFDSSLMTKCGTTHNYYYYTESFSQTQSEGEDITCLYKHEVNCVLTGAELSLEVKNLFQYPEKGSHSISNADLKRECDSLSAPPQSNQFYLIPVQTVHSQKFDFEGIPEAIYWENVKLNKNGVSERISINPEDCSNNPQNAACLEVNQILTNSVLMDRRDPVLLIETLAQVMNKHFAPYLLWLMLAGNFILLLILSCLTFEYFFLKDSGFVINRIRRIFNISKEDYIHADNILTRWRNSFEWLEVIGPSLGFFLTVTALILAFNPTVFSERDTAKFTGALSLAMTSTFAGLIMRMFAVSINSLLDQIIARKTNSDGFLTVKLLNSDIGKDEIGDSDNP